MKRNEFNLQRFIVTAKRQLYNYKFGGTEDEKSALNAVLTFRRYRNGMTSAADASKCIVDFLIDWRMARAGISHGYSEKWLLKNLKSLRQKVSRIGFGKKIENFDVTNSKNTETVKKLFDTLAMNLVEKKIQPTAASKVLFVMAPKLFPMWDIGIGAVMGCNHNAEGYIAYMLKMKWLLKNPKVRRIHISEKNYRLRAFESILWKMYSTSKTFRKG